MSVPDHRPSHRFSPGQSVALARGFPFPVASARVVRRMPATDAGQPMYRVKAEGEPFERLAAERELAPLAK